jgi:C-terminal processing protease CtpA/Prc
MNFEEIQKKINDMNVSNLQQFIQELKYNFKLIPIYEILNVRKNSPAEKAGLLSGDVVVKINGNEVYNLSLDGINRLMKVEGQREVSLVIQRNGKIASYSFKTIDLL